MTASSWAAAALLSNHIVSPSTRSFNLMEESERQEEGKRVKIGRLEQKETFYCHSPFL